MKGDKTSNKSDNEPRSWVEILKQREAERNNPPTKEYYEKPVIKKYEDGGIFPDYSIAPLPDDLKKIDIDTDIYLDSLVQVKKPERIKVKKVAHDHGKDLLSWGKGPYDDELKPRAFRKIKPPFLNEDYNNLTGLPKDSPFKYTVNRILQQREKSQKAMQARQFDPISNTFPTSELEEQRIAIESRERSRLTQRALSKMPPNEKRVHENIVNIITGETTDENAARKFIRDFPSMDVRRNAKSQSPESVIIQKREEELQRRLDMNRYKYNTPGRLRETREYNIISGKDWDRKMDLGIKLRPSAWEWCKMEQIQ